MGKKLGKERQLVEVPMHRGAVILNAKPKAMLVMQARQWGKSQRVRTMKRLLGKAMVTGK